MEEKGKLRVMGGTTNMKGHLKSYMETVEEPQNICIYEKNLNGATK